jgi:hypothetical protein
MATTTNYGWATPDNTDLVKDGALAIRTLGSSVDTTTKALNPSTTLGDIEYRSATANTNTRLGIGSTGNVLTVAGGVPSWAAPSNPTFFILQDNQASGTQGGTFTSGAWRTRDLQTTQVNSISGASVASNQITLGAGTYLVSASAPAWRTTSHQTRFYNITDSSETILGSVEQAVVTNGDQTRSMLEGVFTIAATKVFELQHQCATTAATNGFGAAGGITNEVYSIITIQKVG